MSEESRILNKWAVSDGVFKAFIMCLYFWLAFIILIENVAPSLVSVNSFYLSIIVSIVLGVFLSLVRNRLAIKFQESLTVKGLKKFLSILVIVFFFGIVFFGLISYFGGSVSPMLVPVLGVLILISVPLIPFLDFHTDLGEAVFYFNHAIADNLDSYLTKEGTKKLEDHLKNQGISVSSRDLFFRLNITRMKNEDVTSILKELVNSLKNRDAGLYDVLVKIVEDPSLIKKVDPSSWKNSFQLILSDPKIVQLILLIIWGVVTLANFILTGKSP